MECLQVYSVVLVTYREWTNKHCDSTGNFNGISMNLPQLTLIRVRNVPEFGLSENGA